MITLDPKRQQIIESNRREYPEGYGLLRFPSSSEATELLARRSAIISSLADRVVVGSRGTKLDCRHLSPGCRLCVDGAWSCLFINGRCNCRCFYCPAPQETTGEPTTNTIRFPNPVDYVDYLARFGFRGASISGGEPLLTPEKTLKYLAAIRKKFGADFHLWLYTNGTLLTRDHLLALRDAGLNEIRFDLGAVGYSLDKVRLAAGVIETVTVEIPAVPEDVPLLREKMAEMVESGVRHLNLHQLRLTPHNFSALSARGYTFLHGEKITVLESELAALELLRHSHEEGTGLPVNYCSFVFKSRFQKIAARRRYPRFVIKSCEDVTENGFIRSLSLTGTPEALRRQSEVLEGAGVPRDRWSLVKDRLFFSADVWNLLDFSGLRLLVRYFEAALLPSVTYRNSFVEVPLNRNRKLVVERQPAEAEREVEGVAVEALGRAIRGEDAGTALPEEIRRYELIRGELQEYW